MRQQQHHHHYHHQHPVSCPLTMNADHAQPWLVQHEPEPEPATEVLSGDLYLLTPAADCSKSSSNNNSKRTNSSSSSNNHHHHHHHHRNNNSNNSNNKRARGGSSCGSVRCPVHVQIYRSCFGHYAVVSASLRAPASFLNLRSCNARLCPDSQSRSPSPSPSLSPPPSPPPSPSSSSSSSLPSSSPPSSFSYSSTSSPVCERRQRSQRFRVELGGGEGQVIYFEVSPSSPARGKVQDCVGVDQWIRAFQGCGVSSPGNITPSLSPVIPRNPIMPPLQESLEEEEEEEE